MEHIYKISELAEKAGVSRRTVHYYVGKGLLPPAEGSGVGSRYSEEHLQRILLIKRLQAEYYPLARIRELVSGLDDSGVREMLHKDEPAAGKAGTGQAESAGERYPVYSGAALHMAAPEVSPALASAAVNDAERYYCLPLGQGASLHIPEGLYVRNQETIRSLAAYARKMLEER